MTAIAQLDPHEQPSGGLRACWKAYARASMDAILQAGDVDDVASGALQRTGQLPRRRVAAAFAAFLHDGHGVEADADGDVGDPTDGDSDDIPIYAHPLLPGLLVVPTLVPPPIQTRLLDRMLHDELVCPSHQTNLHLHYDLPYPPEGASFFSYSPGTTASKSSTSSTSTPSPLFPPKDPAVHRPLSIRQVLDRRLHWVTLGGQYDWTHRVYVDNAAVPPFPPDLAALLAGLFPATAAQAAIVNLYTPGDTMMLHRDVSEQTDRGLISVSLGCDALFMAAPTQEFAAEVEQPETNTTNTTKTEIPQTDSPSPSPKEYVLLRLRSGDAIYMTGHARFAWHGVPKVVQGTCPAFMADWPAGPADDPDGLDPYAAWRGWMRNKRVNLNVRQMRE